MTTTTAPIRTVSASSRARRPRLTPARLLAGALFALALTHLYWATGAVWPAPDEYTLSRAVLGFGAEFGPSVTVPEGLF